MRSLNFIGTFLLLLLAGYVTCQASESSTGRTIEKIDNNWKFAKGDYNSAERPEFDDAAWRTLDLPHDWSVEGPYNPELASCTGYLPGGTAWYRKTIDVAAGQKDKKIYIYFEGIYRNSEVFINGHSLGMRPNGYISYFYDLSPFIKFGQKNTIAVRVDHSESADSRWYTGSGIYRDVYLIYTNAIHIALWGIYFTAPDITDKQASARVETAVQNTTNTPVTIEIIHEFIDSQNQTVAKSEKEVALAASEVKNVTQDFIVDQPQLWSIEHPCLYLLRTSIFQKQKLIDSVVEKVGIRTLGFDANTGFSLNGKSMKVKGVCLHHDSGCLGSAVYRDVWQRRLENLKALGCNAIRTSHNPRSSIFYELCDELGLLVLDEAFDEWEFPKKKWLKGWNVGTPGFQGAAEFFEAWGQTDLREMIRRDRNHPSIFMWSIGNEVDYPNDPYSHPILDKEGIDQQHTSGYLPDQPDAERLGGIAKKLAAIVREYDPSRPVTAGLAGPVMSNETEYPGALDVVGYNYTERRYARDHKTYPERVLYGSENRHDYPAWLAVRDNDYIFGQFIWTGIDYLGEALAWPSRGFGSGLLDLGGFKKPLGYFRESLWSDRPMIYCGTNQMNNRRHANPYQALPSWNYKDGEMVRVVVYTNCEKARLLLNGQQISEIKEYDNEKGFLSWDVPFKPGKLEAIGYNTDKPVAQYTIATDKAPDSIQAKAWKNAISHAEGVAQIELQIDDKNGNPVFLANNEITCTATGPLKLIGLEASNPADMGDYTDNKQNVYHGRMIAYLRATGKQGVATVTFTSPGLGDSVVEIEVK
ncbi:DUF4982 domain-containing protein [candidate division KSB1 bacterium]|nr:DUF4982 domain-containing protein [candidate division KSB1 bacterium]